MILKAFSTTSVQLANHGETTSMFQETIVLMSEAASETNLEGMIFLTWKSVRDGFKNTIADRRRTNRSNMNAPLIFRMKGEKEVRLDDLLLEMDEHEGSMRKDKDDRNARERKLMEAGRLILTPALQRQANLGISRGIGSVDEVAVEDEEMSANADRRIITVNVAA